MLTVLWSATGDSVQPQTAASNGHIWLLILQKEAVVPVVASQRKLTPLSSLCNHVGQIISLRGFRFVMKWTEAVFSAVCMYLSFVDCCF